MNAAQQLRARYAEIRNRIDPVRPNVVYIPKHPAVVAEAAEPARPHDQHEKAREVWLAAEKARSSGASRRPSVSSIISETCRYFGVSRADLIGQARHGYMIEARHVAMFLARKLTTRSLPAIAGHFGGRDHTTVLHAVRKMSARVEYDSKLIGCIEAVERMIAAKAVSAGA